VLRETICFVLFLAVCFAQAPPAQSEPPRFEAASIRPSNPEELAGPSGMQTGRGLVRATNVTLKRTIAGAYGVGQDRILGGPEWSESDRFQITAKADQPVGEDVLNAMLQTLLAERFKLVLHRVARTGETMVLEVAKNGPKLPPAGAAPPSYNNGHSRLDATGLSMSKLVEILSRDLKLPVVDRTGLKGAYNFTLRWNPDSAGAIEPDDAAAALRLEMSTAIAQQLGLSLKSQRTPVEMLVIDHAEKPSAN
jgi:uncharacterized protein (TIGR03435 family)